MHLAIPAPDGANNRLSINLYPMSLVVRSGNIPDLARIVMLGYLLPDGVAYVVVAVSRNTTQTLPHAGDER